MTLNPLALAPNSACFDSSIYHDFHTWNRLQWEKMAKNYPTTEGLSKCIISRCLPLPRAVGNHSNFWISSCVEMCFKGDVTEKYFSEALLGHRSLKNPKTPHVYKHLQSCAKHLQSRNGTQATLLSNLAASNCQWAHASREMWCQLC